MPFVSFEILLLLMCVFVLFACVFGSPSFQVGSLTQSNEAYEWVKARAPVLKAEANQSAAKPGLSASEVAQFRAAAQDATKAEGDATEGVASVFALKDAMERA